MEMMMGIGDADDIEQKKKEEKREGEKRNEKRKKQHRYLLPSPPKKNRVGDESKANKQLILIFDIPYPTLPTLILLTK